MSLPGKQYQLPPYLFQVLLLLLAIFQCYSVPYFMPPWYDETFFASISHSYANTGKFNITIQPLLSPNGEFLFYGPVYYFLQALPIQAGLFSIWWFRLLNFLGAWISILLLYQLICFAGVDKKKRLWFVLLVATNLDVVTNASSGRMDMLSFCFFCGALYCWRNICIKKAPNLFQITGGCIFITLAFLTTPRIIFLCLLPAICLAELILISIAKRAWLTVIQICLIPVIIFLLAYFTWIQPRFNSLDAYVHLFTEHGNKIVQLSFLNNLLYDHSFYLLSGAFFLLYTFNKIPGENKTFMIAIFITAIVFVFVVAPVSFYHCMIVPLLMWLMSFCWQINDDTSSAKKIPGYLFKTIAIVQIAILSIKYTIILTDMPARKAAVIQRELASQIPAGSRVIGNFNFYYAAINNGYSFECIEDLLPNEKTAPISTTDKLRHQLTEFDFDYVVVSANHAIPNEYIGHTQFIHRITVPLQGSSLLHQVKTALGLPYQYYYDATVYKRIRHPVE